MKYAFVAIGASLGGLQAVKVVVSALPATFRLPIALVQHRMADAGDELAFVLGENCALPVREAEDKAPIEPGTLFIAPPGYHLMVEGDHFALSTEEPVAWARPSIDVLFETAAEAFGPRLIAVVLSGTGEDGSAGLAAVERHGGTTVVQAPETAVASDMPRAAANAVQNEATLPLMFIGPYLVELGLKG
jgi:two-component system chemotaxis response regulator CheB